MLHITKRQRYFQYIVEFFSWSFSSKLNPLHHLGAIAILMFAIDCISGLYLFFFYSVDPRHTYESVEAISSNLLGSVMRGLHRYSSAGLIATTVLHALHIFLTDKFRAYRWLAWFTGILSLLTFLVIGISGYLLVWDTKAQLIGILTGKLFGSPATASNFVGILDEKYLGGLFRMLLYLHIAISILVIFILWVHVMRNARPRLIPPRPLWVSITLFLVFLSLVLPAKSDPKGDPSRVPFEITLDWTYFFVYPLLKYLTPQWMGVVVVSSLLVLFALPWIVRGKRNPPAFVKVEACTGCERCYMECPYEAIVMREYPNESKKKAFVLQNKCAGCGICIGSCTFGASTIDVYPYEEVLREVREKRPHVVMMRCPFAPTPPSVPNSLLFEVPCIGAVSSSHIKELLKLTKGLVLIACEEEDCYYREGVKWEANRLERFKDARIMVIEAPNVRDISKEVKAFVDKLGEEGRGLKVIARERVRYAFASPLFLLMGFSLYPLSSYHKVSFYPQDKSLLVLSFKYRSTPSQREKIKPYRDERYAVYASGTGRSPLKVELLEGGRLVYSKTFQPKGLRKDGPIFVFDDLVLEPGRDYTLRIEETLFKDRSALFSVDKLKPGESLVILYDEGTNSLHAVKRPHQQAF